MAKQIIDGMEALRKKLGDDDFIKLAIENSFFFCEEIVADRQSDLNSLLQHNKALPARKTSKITSNSNYWQADGHYYEKNNVCI